MGYRIEGDGSYQHTKIWRDGKPISYESCMFRVDEVCIAQVDGITSTLDSIMLTGIYTIIGQGDFCNTKVLFMDEVLRGVQRIDGFIEKGQHPRLKLDTIMLPNLIENP